MCHPTGPAAVLEIVRSWDRSEAPLTDGFVGNGYAAFSQEVFYVPQAQAESVLEPHGMADDLWWESVSSVARRVVLHGSSLPADSSI